MTDSSEPPAASHADSSAPRAPMLCPHCKAVYDTADEIEGKRVKCKVCGHVWRADSRAADKVMSGLQDAVAHLSTLGSTLMAAADHASTIGDLVTQTAREPRPPAGEWVGRRLGRYDVKAVLGQGAMGYVYEALDVELKRTVALKVLPVRLDQRETLGHKLFLQEARTAARLQHANIVTIFDVGQADGTYYIAMELIQGLTLMSLVKQRGPLPIDQACYVGAQAAKALYAGHIAGVVHRDVKPGNIMIDNEGLVKLLDFGLADVANVEAPSGLAGVALGTPGWISPEVARGERATPASDIYGLGLTLYYILTGRRLIRAKTRSGMLELQKNAVSVNPADLPTFWPSELRSIVAGCLAADPADRYQSAHALSNDLMRVAGSTTGSSAFNAKTVDVGGRSRWPIGLVAVVLVAALCAAGYWAWLRWS